MFRSISIVVYAVLAYAVGMVSLAYLFAWYGNLWPGSLAPASIDGKPTGAWAESLAINVFLFLGFCIQHSVMARPAFKERWTKVIPAYLERSTFVLCSGVALLALLVLWQPLGGEIWSIQNQVVRCVLHSLYCLGWMIVVGSTFALSHADFFGLRQAWFGAKRADYTPIKFATPWPYRLMRHPLYFGLIPAFLELTRTDVRASHFFGDGDGIYFDGGSLGGA